MSTSNARVCTYKALKQPLDKDVDTTESNRERSRQGQPREPKEVMPLQAYTVEQVAKMLHIGRDKVYELLRTGQLRSLKIGKLRRITDEQLAEFIASREDHAA